MIRRLCDRLSNEQYQRVQFQCSPFHTNTALYPAINFLRQAAGLTSADSAQVQRDKLSAMARDSDIEYQTTVSLLAAHLSINADHWDPTLPVSSEKRKDTTLETHFHLLEHSPQRTPP